MIFGGEDIEGRLRARFEGGDPRDSAAAAISWAAVKQNRGEPAAALELLREAACCEDRATSARAWLALAESFAEIGEEEGARRAFTRVAELSDPALTPDVAIDLAGRAEADDDPRAAAEIYAEVIAAGPGPALATLAALRLAAIHRADDRPRLALEVLEQALGAREVGELAVEAELVLAEVLLSLWAREPGHDERAEELLEAVVEADHPDHSPRAALLLARRLGARRNFSRAFELLVAVIGCASPEVVAEADAELSAQIARQAEPQPPVCVPLAWCEGPVPAEDEPGELDSSPAVRIYGGALEDADIMPLRPRLVGGGLLGSTTQVALHHACGPDGNLPSGYEIDLRGSVPRSLTIGFRTSEGAERPAGLWPAASWMREFAPPMAPSPRGGLLRRLRNFLAPLPAAHELKGLGTVQAFNLQAFHNHRHSCGPPGGLVFAPLAGMMLDHYEHTETDLEEMLRALDSLRAQAAFPGLVASTAWVAALGHHLDDFELPVRRAWQGKACAVDTCCGDTEEGEEHRAVPDVFTEHRERLAVALAEGIAVGPGAEAVLGISTSTTYTAACGWVARSRVAPPNSSARDDLAHLAVTFEQDLPAFLAGVLKPALERDGVA
jgi:tetratricopeptide (TPR) repeat protein